MTIDFRKVIEENKEQFYQDLDQVMQIESVKGTPAKQAPFRERPQRSLTHSDAGEPKNMASKRQLLMMQLGICTVG